MCQKPGRQGLVGTISPSVGNGEFMNQLNAEDYYRLVIQNCRSAGQIVQAMELQCERGNLSFMHQIRVEVPGLNPEDLSQGEDGKWYMPFSMALAAGASALDGCDALASECEDAAIKGESVVSRLP